MAGKGMRWKQWRMILRMCISLQTRSVVHDKAHDNWQKARSEALKKQPISDLSTSWWFFWQFYCLKSPLVKKISLCLQILFSVRCTVGFLSKYIRKQTLIWSCWITCTKEKIGFYTWICSEEVWGILKTKEFV